MKKIKQIGFIFNIDNVIDLITNSSSELFIFQIEPKQSITELIESVYPGFRNEYEEPKWVGEDMDIMIQYLEHSNLEPEELALQLGIPSKDLVTYNEVWDKEHKWPEFNKDVLEICKDKILDIIDPKHSTYLMNSLNDNPDWEYQEKLSEIATRIHMG